MSNNEKSIEKFNAMLQQIVNLSYEELVQLSHSTAVECLALLEKSEKEISGVPPLAFLNAFIAATVAVDGIYSAKEKQLISDVFESTAIVDAFVEKVDVEFLKIIDKAFDSFSSDIKAKLSFLAVCIMSVDEKISAIEHAYLLKLIES